VASRGCAGQPEGLADHSRVPPPDRAVTQRGGPPPPGADRHRAGTPRPPPRTCSGRR
jgi:hypothetical protein